MSPEPPPAPPARRIVVARCPIEVLRDAYYRTDGRRRRRDAARRAGPATPLLVVVGFAS